MLNLYMQPLRVVDALLYWLKYLPLRVNELGLYGLKCLALRVQFHCFTGAVS